MSLLVELPRKQLDIKKWNTHIENSTNGLIYHKTDYLDCLSKNWTALIWGDYEYVVPLTYKKILGFRLLQQPAFVQQLGVIGNNITNDVLQIFSRYINDKFDFVAYAFNFENQIFGLEKKKNYILPLNQNYNIISDNFKSDVKSNINKSLRYRFTYTINNDFQKQLIFLRIYMAKDSDM